MVDPGEVVPGDVLPGEVLPGDMAPGAVEPGRLPLDPGVDMPPVDMPGVPVELMLPVGELPVVPDGIEPLDVLPPVDPPDGAVWAMAAVASNALVKAIIIFIASSP